MGGHLYSCSLVGYKEEINGKFGSFDQLVWLGCWLSRDILDTWDIETLGICTGLTLGKIDIQI